MLGRWSAARTRASCSLGVCALRPLTSRALLSTARPARAGSNASPAHDARAGGWMDPFEDNPHFRDQTELSDTEPLEVNLEEYVDPSTDRAAKGWAPRGSDFMDAQSTIPQRERAALSHLFSQYEQRHSDGLPAHSALDFSHLGHSDGSKSKGTEDVVQASKPSRLADEEEDALRALVKGSRLRPKIKPAYREVLRESASVSAQQMDDAMKQVAAALQACTSDVAVWNWAETNVFPAAPAPEAGEETSSPPRPYGMNTPYYQPVLVELVVTLRDRFRSPHMAVALYERMKNASLASYVVGCSGALLKEMLHVYWGSFHDYDRVAQVVSEAQAAGVISYRGKGPHRTSSDEYPLRLLINRINDQVTSEIRTLHTELITLPSEVEEPLSTDASPADVRPVDASPADPIAQQDFWSPSAEDKRHGSAGMYDPLDSDLLPEENPEKGSSAMDLHDLAGSLHEEGEDVFGQVFQEETDLTTVRTTSPFPGGPTEERASLPGKALHADFDGPGEEANSLKRVIKTDFTGQLLAERMSMINRQLGLSETAPSAEEGKRSRRFNHPNFHRPPHGSYDQGPRAY